MTLNDLNAQILIAGMADESIVDGPGFRYVIFTQGCPHRCIGCHNPKTHDFASGEFISNDALVDKIILNPMLQGVTISGGEPFIQAKRVVNLIRKLKIKRPNFDYFVYSGYTFEELLDLSNQENGYQELLKEIDFLVDGRFDLQLKNELLLFRGSSNQRIINVKASFEQNKIILYEEEK